MIANTSDLWTLFILRFQALTRLHSKNMYYDVFQQQNRQKKNNINTQRPNLANFGYKWRWAKKKKLFL